MANISILTSLLVQNDGIFSYLGYEWNTYLTY